MIGDSSHLRQVVKKFKSKVNNKRKIKFKLIKSKSKMF